MDRPRDALPPDAAAPGPPLLVALGDLLLDVVVTPARAPERGTVPEPDALPRAEAEAAIAEAVAWADAAGIHGPAATPAILARIAERTDGRSVRANLALIAHNAGVAAAIAAALADPSAPEGRTLPLPSTAEVTRP